MARDLLFKEDAFVFSYRVGGILIRSGKILLQRPKGDDYAIIGGHVAFPETTEQALRREFWEELHARIDVRDLAAVGEIFFPWKDRTCQQICLYYRVELRDASIPLDGAFHGWDELDGERLDLEYCWVPLDELRGGLKVYPRALIPHILEGKPETAHFVSRED